MLHHSLWSVRAPSKKQRTLKVVKTLFRLWSGSFKHVTFMSQGQFMRRVKKNCAVEPSNHWKLSSFQDLTVRSAGSLWSQAAWGSIFCHGIILNMIAATQIGWDSDLWENRRRVGTNKTLITFCSATLFDSQMLSALAQISSAVSEHVLPVYLNQGS